MAVYLPEHAKCLRMSMEYRHPFRHRAEEYFDEMEPHSDRALTTNVRNMIALSAAIRAKPDWWTKAQNPTIRAKWKEEAVGADVPHGDIPLNEKEVGYVLDELAWHAERRDEATGIEMSLFHRIWQSDRLVEEDLRSGLMRSVSALENVPEDQKDWHPRANEQVLDLVHPSLYCIVYGRTTVAEGHEALTQHPPLEELDDEDSDAGYAKHFLSERFSWLPTDFAISSDGKHANPLGYISNLSPWDHGKDLYPIMGQLVIRFVHMWEHVLGETRMGDEFHLPARIPESSRYEWVPKEGCEDEEEDEEDDDYDEHKNHDLVLPPIFDKFEPYVGLEPINLRGRNVQVIVKLANIHLTPEKPSYPGGSWHVEGMLNEAIVSTGIYYYDEDNITTSSLAFRMAVHAPLYEVEQSDDKGATAAYGMATGDSLCQVLGSVVTKQGRCIAFPNVYQHQVQPFELADKSKPGHRKIVALFLVDPGLEDPRPSTSDIPPQQQDWMRALLRDIAAKLGAGPHNMERKGLGKLPPELLDMIVDQAEWLMSREEAEAHRLRLMDERGPMTATNNEDMFETGFSMCEH